MKGINVVVKVIRVNNRNQCTKRFSDKRNINYKSVSKRNFGSLII